MTRGPLGGEQRAQLAFDPPDHAVRADLVAVSHHPGHLETGIDLDAGLFDATGTGDDSRCARYERSPTTGTFGYHCRGEVAEWEEILGERDCNGLADRRSRRVNVVAVHRVLPRHASSTADPC